MSVNPSNLVDGILDGPIELDYSYNAVHIFSIFMFCGAFKKKKKVIKENNGICGPQDH
jgi:hypothetical protein